MNSSIYIKFIFTKRTDYCNERFTTGKILKSKSYTIFEREMFCKLIGENFAQKLSNKSTKLTINDNVFFFFK